MFPMFPDGRMTRILYLPVALEAPEEAPDQPAPAAPEAPDEGPAPPDPEPAPSDSETAQTASAEPGEATASSSVSASAAVCENGGQMGSETGHGSFPRGDGPSQKRTRKKRASRRGRRRERAARAGTQPDICPHCYRSPCIGEGHGLFDALHPLTERQRFERRVAEAERDAREWEMRRRFGLPSPRWDL